MSQTDQLTPEGGLRLQPGKRVAVLACADARLSPHRALGLHLGDAHVIRHAAGSVDDTALRSLAISQNLFETEEIILIDLGEEVRAGVERIRTSPSIPHSDSVRGFVYEVESGALREVV